MKNKIYASDVVDVRDMLPEDYGPHNVDWLFIPKQYHNVVRELLMLYRIMAVGNDNDIIRDHIKMCEEKIDGKF